MTMPSNRSLRGRWRRRLFWAWVAGSVLVAAYVGVAGPIADNANAGRDAVALAAPAIMVFMLATGLGWLVLLVTSHRDREPGERDSSRSS